MYLLYQSLLTKQLTMYFLNVKCVSMVYSVYTLTTVTITRRIIDHTSTFNSFFFSQTEPLHVKIHLWRSKSDKYATISNIQQKVIHSIKKINTIFDKIFLSKTKFLDNTTNMVLQEKYAPELFQIDYSCHYICLRLTELCKHANTLHHPGLLCFCQKMFHPSPKVCHHVLYRLQASIWSKNYYTLRIIAKKKI